MTWSFAEDGRLSMTTSLPQMPEPRTQEGTYTVSNGEITISVRDRPKTGTYRFEGNDKLIIEIDKMQMTLSRS